MNDKYIYVMISRTTTGFGRVIRYIGRMQYNHTALSLDEDLKELYAFSRPQHHAIFMGRLVRETLDRYTMKKDRTIPVTIFRLKVTHEQYDQLRQMIYQSQRK